MSQEKRLEKIEKDKLPLLYRVLLKVPFPAINTSVTIPSGIFWAMIVPVFIILELFLNLYLLLAFSFPINILLVFVFPVVLFVIFIRITMDRFINWWNSAVVGGYTPREIRKVLEEYLALRKDKNKKDASDRKTT